MCKEVRGSCAHSVRLCVLVVLEQASTVFWVGSLSGAFLLATVRILHRFFERSRPYRDRSVWYLYFPGKSSVFSNLLDKIIPEHSSPFYCISGCFPVLIYYLVYLYFFIFFLFSLGYLIAQLFVYSFLK